LKLSEKGGEVTKRRMVLGGGVEQHRQFGGTHVLKKRGKKCNKDLEPDKRGGGHG